MPWLVKNKDRPEQELFFVHVPRCGGTSLMHHFDVPRKALREKSLIGKIFLSVFFNRYKILESANFPVWTWGNFVSLILVITGVALLSLSGSIIDSVIATSIGGVAIGAGIFISVSLTFLFTAPVIGRVTIIHRAYLIFVHHILCRLLESRQWVTGTNMYGYLMHLTAGKLLAYKYVTVEQMNSICTMAIVRNPYSRFVSMYSYNRFLNESFPHFCKAWYKVMKNYREKGHLEEWYTPCHAIPQFEYTHYDGRQLVRSIVKQEELKYLKTEDDRPKAIQQDSTVADLPDIVRDALLGMPRTNQRKTNKKWFDYYDQETLDLVYEMYADDFDVFKYNPVLEQRPDLKAPKGYVQEDEIGLSLSEQIMEIMVRDSIRSTEVNRSLRHDSIVRSSQTPVQVGRPRSISHINPRNLADDLEEGAADLHGKNRCMTD